MGWNDQLPSPPVRQLTSAEANTMLAAWHYLGAVRGVLYAYGHDEGCCVFTNLRSRILEKSYQAKVIELGRMVGCPGHLWAMSSLMAKCLAALKRDTDYEVVITYADPLAGHSGAVYRAANWVYEGEFHPGGHPTFYIDGKRVSPRTLYDRHGTQSVAAMKEVYGARLRLEAMLPKKRFSFRLYDER